MDPLSLLRSFTMEKKAREVLLQGSECIFGDSGQKFPRNQETACKKMNGQSYTLAALVVFAWHLELKHGDYIKKANAEGVTIVTFTDRKSIQDFLEGRPSPLDSELPLLVAAPLGTPDASRAAKRLKTGGEPPLDEQGTAPPAASALTEASREEGVGAPHVDPVLEEILAKERPLRSMESLMLCLKKPDMFAGVLGIMARWDKETQRKRDEKKRGETASGVRAFPATADPTRHRSRLPSAPGSHPGKLLAHPSSRHSSKPGDVRAAEPLPLPPPPPPFASAGAQPPAPFQGRGATGAGLAPAAVAAGLSAPDEKQHWKAYMGSDAAEALGIDPTQSYMHGVTPPQQQQQREPRAQAEAAPGPPLALLPPPPPAPSLAAQQRHASALPAPPSATKAPPTPGSGGKSASAHDAHARHQRRTEGTPHPRGSGTPSAHQSVPRTRPGHSHSSGRGGSGAGKAGDLAVHPIILVPSATQTLVNMFNVAEFLGEGRFVAPAEKMKALAPGEQRPEVVQFMRTMGRDRPVQYEARDKVTGFKEQDWERVVAVFVLGKEWQFKGWPYKDAVEALSKVMGVFVRYEDDSVEAASTAKQWNCHIISISNYKRHQDGTNVLNFWSKLDSFLKAKRTTLTF